MGRTNTTISIYRKPALPTSGDNPTLVGSYAVWLQERIDIVTAANDLDIPAAILEQAKGLVIMWDDVDLSNCYMTYDSKDWEITGMTRFMLKGNRFHHKEFFYA
jgi:hypothetical protein